MIGGAVEVCPARREGVGGHGYSCQQFRRVAFCSPSNGDVTALHEALAPPARRSIHMPQITSIRSIPRSL
jgi:hypothetical protein